MHDHRGTALARVLSALSALPLLGGCAAESTPAESSATRAQLRSENPPAPHEPEPRRLHVSDPPAAIHAWLAYARPATYDVVSSKVKVPARDGTLLDCTLGRPARDGRVAASAHPGLVAEFTPYALQAEQYQNEAAYFVRRGYDALVCLLRGIGGSGGTWQHPFAAQDGRDAHDLVEWLAAQPFSNGRIGMFGESYGGATTYGAAVEQAPHLRAIAPLQSPGTLYDDVNYPGGIEATAKGPLNFWPTLAELMSFGKISAAEEFALYHAHPTYDGFWQERTFRGRYDRVQVPVLAMGGWVDNFFREGTLTNIEPLRDRTWVFYGQWIHTIPVDLGTCATQCAPDPLPGGVLLAWFDRWLMERTDTPVPAQPTFLSAEGPKGAGKGWRALSEWLPEGPEASHYQLGSDGTLAVEAAATQPRTFHEPGDATQPGASLTFTTSALERDRVLIGRALLDLRATLSGSDANFYVQLLDVDARDTETLVNDGFLKASHRTSHTSPTPVTPGQAIDYRIEVRPQHHRFLSGHRVRVRLWGGPTNGLVQPSPVDVTIATGAHATLSLPGFAASD